MSRRHLAVLVGEFPATLLHLLGAEQFRAERAVAIDSGVAEAAFADHPEGPRRTPSILVGHCCSRRGGSLESTVGIDHPYVAPRA